MQFTREMRIGAAALAFIGAIAWMLPPTTPVAPVSAPGQFAVRAHASGAVSDAAYSPPPAPPGSFDAGGEAPPIAADRGAESLSDPAAPRWRDAEDAADDARPDPDFMTGYDWAETNAIARRGDCRRWRGTAAEDGCRTFVNDAPERDAERELSEPE